MAKIYLPSNLVNKDCKVVYNDYVRVYTNSQHTSYTDVYFKSGYYTKEGTTSNPPYSLVCDNSNTYTDNVFFRYDMSDTLLIFFILFIFCFYMPFRIIGRAFGRWLRV